MAFFLGIDNGGTKTDYVLACETRELARVRTATLKLMRTNATTATANLESALQELTARSGISMQSIERTCIGTAGHSVPLVADWLREEISARVAGELILVNDVEIALDAAFPGGPGVMVLAGTGSNVVGRSEQGELSGVGGWGPVLADQGSGHSIGLHALRAIFLTIDEGRTTSLHDAVLSFWDLRDRDHLVAYANQLPSPDFSRLTELVLRCAAEGDETAAAVLRKEGESLGYRVRLVLRRLTALRDTGAEASLPALAFAGSIMQRVIPVRDALIAAVREEFPAVRTLDGVVDPIAGALWRARTGVARGTAFV